MRAQNRLEPAPFGTRIRDELLKLNYRRQFVTGLMLSVRDYVDRINACKLRQVKC